MTSLKIGVFIAVAGVVAAALPTQSMAAVVNLNQLLTNATFEAGTVGNACPAGWTCSGGVGTAAPTAAQYPAPNGLPDGLFVPSGNLAAFSPTATASTSSLKQSITGLQWVAGNTYTLDFWLGNPLDGGMPEGFKFSWLADGVGSNLCDGWGSTVTLASGALSQSDTSGHCVFEIKNDWLPEDGDWRHYEATFVSNRTVAIGSPVGVMFEILPKGSGGNGYLAHLDIGPVPAAPDTKPPDGEIPEPGSLALVGLALAGVAAARRRV